MIVSELSCIVIHLTKPISVLSYPLKGNRKEGSPLCESIPFSWSSLMLGVWCLAGNDTDMCDNKVT